MREMSRLKKTFVRSSYKCENHVPQALEGLGVSQAAAWGGGRAPCLGLGSAAGWAPWDGAAPKLAGSLESGFPRRPAVRTPSLAPAPVRGTRGSSKHEREELATSGR